MTESKKETVSCSRTLLLLIVKDRGRIRSCFGPIRLFVTNMNRYEMKVHNLANILVYNCCQFDRYMIN